MRINILFSYYEIYYDWAVTASYCLRKLGIESDVYCPCIGKRKRGLGGWIYPEADYYIVLNMEEFFLRNIPKDAKTIAWFTEQVDFDRTDLLLTEKNNGLLGLRENCDFLIVSHKMTEAEAVRNNIKVDGVFGLSYDEILTKYANNVERDIDIYFEGGINDRRREIINKFSIPITSHGFYVDEYHKNMARAKIALNIHSFDCKTNHNFLRIITAISEKALVVSETIKDCYPLESGNHLIICPIGELPSVCEEYLVNYDENRRIANNAFDYIKKHYRMDNLLYNFIKSNIDSGFERKNIEAEVPEVQI